MDQIGLNVLNARCLETGILSRDNPPIDLAQCLRSWNRHKKFWSQSPEFLWICDSKKWETNLEHTESRIHKRVSTCQSTLICQLSLTQIFTGLPWELPEAAGSQEAGHGEVRHGRWRCFECCGSEGPVSSSLVLSWALDPGNGQTLAALGARPLTSQPGEGGVSGCAWRGEAGLGENWRPQPTQGQRQERAVKWISTK